VPAGIYTMFPNNYLSTESTWKLIDIGISTAINKFITKADF
jgi:hypothetical protein